MILLWTLFLLFLVAWGMGDFLLNERQIQHPPPVAAKAAPPAAAPVVAPATGVPPTDPAAVVPPAPSNDAPSAASVNGTAAVASNAAPAAPANPAPATAGSHADPQPNAPSELPDAAAIEKAVESGNLSDNPSSADPSH